MKQDGWTQERIGQALGVAQRTVSHWLDDVSFSQLAKANTLPDVRVKVPAKEYAPIVERLERGETQQEIADDYNVLFHGP